MKSTVLIVLIAFLVVSFGFLDGWPFRSTKPGPSPSLETLTQQEDNAVSPSTSGPGEVAAAVPTQAEDGAHRDEAPASEIATMTVREGLVAARELALDQRLKALSDVVLRFDLPRDFRFGVLDELRQLSREQVVRGAKGLATERVAVVSGDNLTRIAQRVQKSHGGNISPAMVMKLNGLQNDRIRVGQQLMVPTGRLEVLIVKADHRLYVMVDGVIVLDYPIGIGHDNSTPEGAFTIVNKTVNPTWRMPDGRVIPFGHPEHIIGNRWMGFADSTGPTSYGIHGTVAPESIGKNESDGCVRMLESDVEEVFRLVPEGCPVRLLP